MDEANVFLCDLFGDSGCLSFPLNMDEKRPFLDNVGGGEATDLGETKSLVLFFIELRNLTRQVPVVRSKAQISLERCVEIKTNGPLTGC